MQHPTLETSSGMAIVPVTLAHAAMLAALVCHDKDRPNVYLPMVATLSSPETARVHLERAAVHVAEGDIFEWHLFVRDRLCGSVRLKDVDHGDPKASIAYFLSS